MKNNVSRMMLWAAISTVGLPATIAKAQSSETLDARVAPSSHVGGLTSDQVAARAKVSSFNAAGKREALNAAAARVDQALVAYYPKVQLTARYQRLSPVTQPLVNTGSGLQAFPSFLDVTVLQAALTIPLTDYVLRISQAYAAASRNKRAAALDEQAAMLKAAADGKQAYYGWLRAKAQVLVAERALDQAKSHLEDARHSFEVGTASKADVLQVESQVASAELVLEQSKNLAAINEEQIRIAMHDAREQPYEVGEDLRADLPPLPASDSLASLRAEAFNKRLEIRALDETVWSFREQGKAARAAYYPRVDAIGDLFYSNPNQRIFPQEAVFRGTWDVGVQLTWTPNDALTARGASSESNAKAAQTEFQKAELRDSVRLEVMQAYQALREAEVAVETTKRGLHAAEESYRVRRELFKSGRATSVELTDSEFTLTRVGVDAINARANLRSAFASLTHATGRDVPPAMLADSK